MEKGMGTQRESLFVLRNSGIIFGILRKNLVKYTPANNVLFLAATGLGEEI